MDENQRDGDGGGGGGDGDELNVLLPLVPPLQLITHMHVLEMFGFDGKLIPWKKKLASFIVMETWEKEQEEEAENREDELLGVHNCVSESLSKQNFARMDVFIDTYKYIVAWVWRITHGLHSKRSWYLGSSTSGAPMALRGIFTLAPIYTSIAYILF